MEVLAEIRKLDFEQIMRQGNRLMWGKDSRFEGSRKRTREQRELLSAGGTREFEMEPLRGIFCRKCRTHG